MSTKYMKGTYMPTQRLHHAKIGSQPYWKSSSLKESPINWSESSLSSLVKGQVEGLASPEAPGVYPRS